MKDDIFCKLANLWIREGPLGRGGEPNLKLRISKLTRLRESHPAILEWSTDGKSWRQHPAQQRQPPGGTRHLARRSWTKTQDLDFLSVVSFHGFHLPAQSMMIASFATMSYQLMPSGCIDSAHYQ